MGIRAEIYRDFAALPAHHREMIETASHTSFDQSLPWMESLAALSLGNGERLRILALEREDTGASLAVLPTVAGPRRGPLRGRALRALSNYYSGHFGPILNEAEPVEPTLDALVGALLDSDAQWDACDLNPMDPESAAFEVLIVALRRRCHVFSYHRFANWYLEVAGRSAAEYFTSLPTVLRDTLRRKSRKLRELAPRVVLMTGTDELDAGLRDYEHVYRVSWKRRESRPELIREIARRFASRGWLRLGLIYLKDRPAAAQMWFVHNRTASIFKLAHDEQYAAYSVGSLLTKRMMEEVIDGDHVDVVDYLSGDEKYKQQWMSGRRYRKGIRAYRRNSAAGMAGALYTYCGQQARRLSSVLTRRWRAQ